MSQEMPAPDVGGRIRLLREKRGLSLRGLAARCGLSVNAISRIEHGENSPTVASLHLLAQALGVPIAAFFQFEAQGVRVRFRRNSRLSAGHSDMAIQSLGAGLSDQQLEPFLVTLSPGA
ncbi:MAG: XRE family transcriptional regulator, partial [Planctomycetaceae bacterium]